MSVDLIWLLSVKFNSIVITIQLNEFNEKGWAAEGILTWELKKYKKFTLFEKQRMKKAKI